MEELVKDISSLHYTAPMLNSYNQKAGAFQQILAPEPIQIKIDSATDPGVVLLGLGGIISSIVIAIFTYRVQRNQIKANVSNLRHHWRNELRDCAAEFLQKVTTIIRCTSQTNNFVKTAEGEGLLGDALRLQIKISLLLSGNSDLAQKITTASTNIIKDAKKFKHGSSPESIAMEMANLETLVKEQLEVSWQDIQSDLGLNKTFFSVSFRTRKSLPKNEASGN